MGRAANSIVENRTHYFKNGFELTENTQGGAPYRLSLVDVDTLSNSEYALPTSAVVSSALRNYVTLDTTQTITGAKIFTRWAAFNSGVSVSSDGINFDEAHLQPNNAVGGSYLELCASDDDAVYMAVGNNLTRGFTSNNYPFDVLIEAPYNHGIYLRGEVKAPNISNVETIYFGSSGNVGIELNTQHTQLPNGAELGIYYDRDYPALFGDLMTLVSSGGRTVHADTIFRGRQNGVGFGSDVTLKNRLYLAGEFLDGQNSFTKGLEYDSQNHAWHLRGNFYADGFVSAGGISSTSGSSVVSITDNGDGSYDISNGAATADDIVTKTYVTNALAAYTPSASMASLTFGSKSYNGSTAQTLTAADIGALTSITSSMVTTALGYTPYNGATNPNGYITSYVNNYLSGVSASGTTITFSRQGLSALTLTLAASNIPTLTSAKISDFSTAVVSAMGTTLADYVTLGTRQTITGIKDFSSELNAQTINVSYGTLTADDLVSGSLFELYGNADDSLVLAFGQGLTFASHTASLILSDPYGDGILINGDTTFTGDLTVTAFSNIKAGNTTLQAALNAKADDSGVVHLAGTETITGAKTFTGALDMTYNYSNFPGHFYHNLFANDRVVYEHFYPNGTTSSNAATTAHLRVWNGTGITALTLNGSTGALSWNGNDGGTFTRIYLGTSANNSHYIEYANGAFHVVGNLYADGYVSAGGLSSGGGGGGITVDTALSSTSTNPVQNKVIYAAIGDVETLLAAI